LSLNLQDENSGSPPDHSTNSNSNLAKDALSLHIQKWYNGETEPVTIAGEAVLAFYTREELEQLGINLLEKE
jgi:hypothetical protein